ncbi:hypothetical protein KIPB_016764, partial [Kipferlia bialata]
EMANLSCTLPFESCLSPLLVGVDVDSTGEGEREGESENVAFWAVGDCTVDLGPDLSLTSIGVAPIKGKATVSSSNLCYEMDNTVLEMGTSLSSSNAVQDGCTS